MNISYSVWQQLRSITAAELCNALERDGWDCDMDGGSMRIYKKSTDRVSVHYHPKKTYGEKLLRGMLTAIGWTDDDARRLKLAK